MERRVGHRKPLGGWKEPFLDEIFTVSEQQSWVALRTGAISDSRRLVMKELFCFSLKIRRMGVQRRIPGRHLKRKS